jgi:hypothetical protein
VTLTGEGWLRSNVMSEEDIANSGRLRLQPNESSLLLRVTSDVLVGSTLTVIRNPAGIAVKTSMFNEFARGGTVLSSRMSSRSESVKFTTTFLAPVRPMLRPADSSTEHPDIPALVRNRNRPRSDQRSRNRLFMVKLMESSGHPRLSADGRSMAYTVIFEQHSSGVMILIHSE